MELLNTLAGIEIAGNKLWRILVLFGIILLALLLGKIARSLLQRSATAARPTMPAPSTTMLLTV